MNHRMIKRYEVWHPPNQKHFRNFSESGRTGRMPAAVASRAAPNLRPVRYTATVCRVLRLDTIGCRSNSLMAEKLA